MPTPKSSFFFYVPIVLLGIVLIALIFNWQYQGGVQLGSSLPPPVKEIAADKIVNHRELAQNTGLAADGKMLYQLNCASCHGNDGQGDGPRSAGLNPPPRNYKTETFKYGTDVYNLHNTLLQGSPGTSMPSFALLPPRDVWAMVHYVRTLIPIPTPTDDAVLAKLPEAPIPAGGNNIELAADTSKNRIPITLAMKQVENDPYLRGKATRAYDRTGSGAQLYLSRCAKCHGEFGEGMASAVLSVNPYRYATTPPLYSYNAPWLTDRAVFDRIVIAGLPGRSHPGFGALTRSQLDELYGFVQSLVIN